MVRPRPLCNHRPTRTKGSQINSKYYLRYPTNRFLTNRGSLGHRPSTHPKVHRKIIHRSTSHRQAWQATRIFPLNLKWFIRSNRCSDRLSIVFSLYLISLINLLLQNHRRQLVSSLFCPDEEKETNGTQLSRSTNYDLNEIFSDKSFCWKSPLQFLF